MYTGGSSGCIYTPKLIACNRIHGNAKGPLASNHKQPPAVPSKPGHASPAPRAVPSSRGQSPARQRAPSTPRTDSARAKASQHKGALLLTGSWFIGGEPIKTPCVILQRITYPSPAVAGCSMWTVHNYRHREKRVLTCTELPPQFSCMHPRDLAIMAIPSG